MAVRLEVDAWGVGWMIYCGGSTVVASHIIHTHEQLQANRAIKPATYIPRSYFSASWCTNFTPVLAHATGTPCPFR